MLPLIRSSLAAVQQPIPHQHKQPLPGLHAPCTITKSDKLRVASQEVWRASGSARVPSERETCVPPALEEQRWHVGPRSLSIPEQAQCPKPPPLSVAEGWMVVRGGPALTDHRPRWLSQDRAACASIVLRTFCDLCPKTKSLKRSCHQVLRHEISDGDS